MRYLGLQRQFVLALKCSAYSLGGICVREKASELPRVRRVGWRHWAKVAFLFSIETTYKLISNFCLDFCPVTLIGEVLEEKEREQLFKQLLDHHPARASG